MLQILNLRGGLTNTAAFWYAVSRDRMPRWD